MSDIADSLVQENRRLEAELAQSRKSLSDLQLIFDTILESTLAGYWDWNIKEERNFMSRTYKSMLGYREDEVPNDPNWWAQNAHPDDVKKFLAAFDDHVRTKGANPVIEELRFFHKDGSTVWIHCRSRVVDWDSAGKPLRMIGYHIDISQLKESEENLTTQTMSLIQKNEELEHFAYVASHDLNEPIRTIGSFVEIIEEETEEQSENDHLKTYFGYIHGALTRMRGMIDGLLLYSRLGSNKELQRVDLMKLVENIKVDLSELLESKNVEIKVTQLPTILCAPSKLRQIFQNLITNGIKFQKEDIKPIIEISCEDTSKYWQFCIADNGIGIEKPYQRKIFNMFTKLHRPSMYGGQGIGLAFCKKIVELHGGEIWVDSDPGMGSNFYFTISKNLIDEKEAQ